MQLPCARFHDLLARLFLRGDPHYVGLMGVEVFDQTGHLIAIDEPLKQVQCFPVSSPWLSPHAASVFSHGVSAMCVCDLRRSTVRYPRKRRRTLALTLAPWTTSWMATATPLMTFTLGSFRIRCVRRRRDGAPGARCAH